MGREREKQRGEERDREGRGGRESKERSRERGRHTWAVCAWILVLGREMRGEESSVSNVLWLVEQRKGKESRKLGEWGFEPSPLCDRTRWDGQHPPILM